jgi:PBSX family phage terminase large subunit
MTLRVEDASLSEDVRSVLARRGVVERGGQQVAHVWRPRGSARTVLVRRDDEVLMSGPAGTGKSRACLEKLNLVALKYPGMHGAILRKTAASLGSSALKTWREDVIPELLANGTVYFYGGSQEEPPQYRYNNGSTIVIGGLDKPSKIMSTEYDMIYVQEATELTVADWESCTSRLRNGRLPYQQLIADCNPDTPTHWLKTRCDEGKTYMINCRHEDNPRLFTLNPDGSFTVTPYGKSYMRKLDNLTGVRHLRLRMGQWVAAEGMIFDDFRAEIHVIDEMPKGWETWSRYWSIDFGFTNPFVLQCWAEDPDGRLYLYREIYRTRRTVDQHARDILAVVAPGGTWNEPKPFSVICDHDAEGRRRFEIETGLGTTPADKKVKEGIETAQRRFRLRDDGTPGIFFIRNAVVKRDQDLIDARKPASTLEEFPGYVWMSGPDGKPVKEDPNKINDHGCDAMRYECVDRDPLSRPRIRSFRV